MFSERGPGPAAVRLTLTNGYLDPNCQIDDAAQVVKMNDAPPKAVKQTGKLAVQGRNWFGTIQLGTDLEIAKMRWNEFRCHHLKTEPVVEVLEMEAGLFFNFDEPSKVSSLIGQLEKGGEGNNFHIQCVAAFATNQRLMAASKAVANGLGHWEICKDYPASVKYCTKQETRVPDTEQLLHGQAVKQQGRRTDIELMKDRVKEMLATSATEGDIRHELVDKWPSQFLQYGGNISGFIAACRQKVKLSYHPLEAWYKWKRDLLEILDGPVDSRAVYFMYDKKGNTGKSDFVRYLISEKGAVQLSGQVKDMALILKGNPDTTIVLFDVPRSSAENMTHLISFAEMCKNGFLVAAKYQSEQLRFLPKHVVFFVNEMPDGIASKTPEGRYMLSQDRIRIWNVYKDAYDAIMPDADVGGGPLEQPKAVPFTAATQVYEAE